MLVSEPITLAYGDMVSSNVAEDEHDVWDPSDTYADEDRVIKNHKIYESVQAANTGNDPETDTSNTWWVEVSATDRWLPFDGKLAPRSTNSGNIEFVFTAPTSFTLIGFFEVFGSSAIVTVYESDNTTVAWTNEVSLVSNDPVFDWYSYYFAPQEILQSVVMLDVPVSVGSRVKVEVTGSLTEVGEIVFGQVTEIGDTLNSTSVGITDYSVKERDEFGAPIIVQRAYLDTVNFRFSIPTNTVGRVRRLLARLRATACVYIGADEDSNKYGTLIYGFYEDFSIPLTTNMSFGTLEVQSLDIQ